MHRSQRAHADEVEVLRLDHFAVVRITPRYVEFIRTLLQRLGIDVSERDEVDAIQVVVTLRVPPRDSAQPDNADFYAPGLMVIKRTQR